MQNNIIALIEEIKRTANGLSQINIMEVCGTHTMAIGKNGLRQVLPQNINLISGPGCPVCVTSISDIDNIIELAENPCNYIFSFGDMLKIPGSKSSLYKKRSEGANIKVCYSPADAFDFAVKNPQKKIIFIAIGFETTAPLTAALIKKAYETKTNNFFIYNTHKIVPPAIEFLLNSSNKNNISAFLCPGHVCAVTGSRPFDFISKIYGKPAVISGFSAEDILKSILMILKQIKNNKPEVEIQYDWVVKENGNPIAIQYMDNIFDINDAIWRGIGNIKKSGLVLKNKFRNFDAKVSFALKDIKVPEPRLCSCGDILLGVKKPFECRLFGKSCKPDNPVGPCMVSSEGTCSAYFKYEKYKT
ncbi:MAG: hydrogenase formation protein HypD [Actinobacteria bacterium]|nr:hydrogenase formation protein HypD [Actinomycetota bacterium]